MFLNETVSIWLVWFALMNAQELGYSISQVKKVNFKDIISFTFLSFY